MIEVVSPITLESSGIVDPSTDEPSVVGLRLTRVICRDFRNHADLDLAVGSRFVALVGENGAGKTNLLESISLFSPGRGLRRADLSSMARNAGSGGFAVSLALKQGEGGTSHRHGLRARRGRRPGHASVPDRRRDGRFPRCLLRVLEGGLADAGSRRVVFAAPPATAAASSTVWSLPSTRRTAPG